MVRRQPHANHPAERQPSEVNPIQPKLIQYCDDVPAKVFDGVSRA